jgi:hypothetical protein
VRGRAGDAVSLPASILSPLIEGAQGMIGEARLRVGKNDVVIFAACIDDADGEGQTSRLFGTSRERILDVLTEACPEATNSLEALTKPVAIGSFLLIVHYRQRLHGYVLAIPNGTEGVLN